MPTADDYAQWIVANADKKGTPDFETVAQAYADARQKPVAVQAGAALNSVPRQIGLTARYELEGLAQSAQLVTEPIRYLTDRLSGSTGKTKPLGAVASDFADAIGLPSPQNATERVIGEGSRLMAGAGGMTSLAQRGVGSAAKMMAANPVQQVLSSAGAGLAGGSSREAGGTQNQQILSSVLGGLTGAGLAGVGNAAIGATTKAKNALLLSNSDIDVKLGTVLRSSGVDYSQVPERIRQSMRNELRSSLNAEKELDPAAVARLLDFKRNNLTPTRGMVSLDPVQITREQNLAKIAANSSDGQLHGLPRIQNQNNSQLIDSLNDAGARSGDMMAAGSSSIGGIASKDASLQAGVKSAYDTARAMPGGNIPLDRSAVVNRIYEALGRENKMAFLPPEVGAMLDTISRGVIKVGGQEHHVPFDANALDNLMTTIATAQRGAKDGNVKAALALARKAIDAAPLSPVKNTFGGGQLVTEQGANTLRAADASAGQFMGALNDARKAAAQRFGWQESGRPIEAALDGAQPDNFIKRFVINGTLKDAQQLAGNTPVEPIKNAIVAHLKDRALNGAADEVGKFSQSAFNKELNALGPKLALFFSKEEIDQLRSMGRAASYMQAQPVGSAVNNSNSGALLLGKGMDLLRQIPIAGPMTAPALENIAINFRQRQAQNLMPGLLARPAPTSPMGGLLIPGMAVGGLLAPQIAN